MTNPYHDHPLRSYSSGTPAWELENISPNSSAGAFQLVVEEVRQRIQRTGLLTTTELEAAGPEAEAKIRTLALELIGQHNATAAGRGQPLLPGEPEPWAAQIVDEILGWGPLADYMRDPQVEEILFNDPQTGFVIYAGGRKERLPRGFPSPEAARSFFNRKIEAGHGYPVNDKNPHQDAQLPDGSRLFVAVPPVAGTALLVDIRRFRPVARTLADLLDLGTITPPLQAFLEAAMQAYLTTVIAGGTGTGKTTFLQALSSAFPPADRVVTIEETPELQLDHLPDWAPLRVRREAEGIPEIGMGALVRDALRMRPTRLILGEARGAEMVDILTACNTGHDGTLFTLHANSVREAVERMLTLYRMGQDLAPDEVRKEIVMAVRLIVHLKRTREGLRYVAGVGEIRRVEGSNMVIEEIFASPGEGQPARFTGNYPACRNHLEERVAGFNFAREVAQR